MTITASNRPKLTEDQFQQQVIDLAKLNGYTLIYHTFNSRRSQPGFPDLVLINEKRRRAMFRELKSSTGRVTEAQHNWLMGMKIAGLDADIWRPEDLASGLITRQLRSDA
ncbi:holliday junction resolvase [Arthrobacter phage Popper]|uniref:Holliday junction resolvase n=1 Tax=Arthrobacter phage Popper TaxID=2859633 RepID=A0AAE8BDI6_9CAUD|nr:holliday junction resolvase [Arthrobacter phage Popper]QYC54982.1 holliday junction resolvase [Arthrobacter phage Popper]